MPTFPGQTASDSAVQLVPTVKTAVRVHPFVPPGSEVGADILIPLSVLHQGLERRVILFRKEP
jgi:hypothetical protein